MRSATTLMWPQRYINSVRARRLILPMSSSLFHCTCHAWISQEPIHAYALLCMQAPAATSEKVTNYVKVEASTCPSIHGSRIDQPHNCAPENERHIRVHVRDAACVLEELTWEKRCGWVPRPAAWPQDDRRFPAGCRVLITIFAASCCF